MKLSWASTLPQQHFTAQHSPAVDSSNLQNSGLQDASDEDEEEELIPEPGLDGLNESEASQEPFTVGSTARSGLLLMHACP